jgi:hypothetical protein
MSEENLVPIPSDYAWGPGDDGDPIFVGVGFENGEVQVPTIRAESVLGYRDLSFQDPNVQPSVETGSDVLVLLDGKRYGVQVTLLHTDEGLTARIAPIWPSMRKVLLLWQRRRMSPMITTTRPASF